MIGGAERVRGFGTTIFAEMTALANRFDAVNLGQGFPDFDGPAFIKEAAVEAIRSGPNQYAPTGGLPELARAICRHQERFWGLGYRPEEVTVYAGATEAIFACLQALCDPGDEVILFEPFYDSYRASVAMAGARERVVTLHDRPDGRTGRTDRTDRDGFVYDPAALEAAIGPKTRLILLNTPHNPTGKVFSRAELEHIAGALPAPRPDPGERRGLRAPGLRGRPPAAGRPAGHARAHRDHLVGRQDLQPHRLEDRLDLRAGAADPRPPGGPPVHHLLQRHAAPAGGRRGSRRRRRLLRRAPRRLPGAARAPVQRPRGGRFRGPAAGGHLLRPGRHPPPRLRRRRRLLPYAARKRSASPRCRRPRSTSVARPAATWSASPSARAESVLDEAVRRLRGLAAGAGTAAGSGLEGGS